METEKTSNTQSNRGKKMELEESGSLTSNTESKVLAKSVRDDIHERLHPYQTDELKDSLTHFSILQLLKVLL